MSISITRQQSVAIWSEIIEYPNEHRWGFIDANGKVIVQNGTGVDNCWHIEHKDALVFFQTFAGKPPCPDITVRGESIIGAYLQEPGVFQMTGYIRDNNQWVETPVRLTT
jgi:hypothetical protein